LASTVTHRSRPAATVIHRAGLGRAVIHRPALGSLPGKRPTCEVPVGARVGVEERQSHEQDKDQGTRKGDWHMVAKKATAQVAAGAKRLIRRSGG